MPDNGAALIFLRPHIVYSLQESWGKIEREGQHEPTTCCGALVNAIEKLKISGAVVNKIPSGDDYQEEVIEQFALQHKNEILNSTDPLITFTKLIYAEAEERIFNMPLGDSKFKYFDLCCRSYHQYRSHRSGLDMDRSHGHL